MGSRAQKALQMAKFYMSDANYLAERIGELHCHAVIHDGELCAKLNRARIGGMIEVLDRMQLAVDCRWDEYDPDVLILTESDYLDRRAAMAASKENAKEGK